MFPNGVSLFLLNPKNQKPHCYSSQTVTLRCTKPSQIISVSRVVLHTHCIFKNDFALQAKDSCLFCFEDFAKNKKIYKKPLFLETQYYVHLFACKKSRVIRVPPETKTLIFGPWTLLETFTYAVGIKRFELQGRKLITKSEYHCVLWYNYLYYNSIVSHSD